MKVTYGKLINCINAGVIYTAQQEGKENKLTYAIKRFSKQNMQIAESYTYLLSDLKVDLASVDDRGNLIKNKEEYSYTKENQKKLTSAIRDLNNKEVEVEVYIISDDAIPDNLPANLRDVFDGLLIPASQSE